jgi:hypothetical protein
MKINALLFLFLPLFGLGISHMIVRPTPCVYEPVVIEVKDDL